MYVRFGFDEVGGDDLQSTNRRQFPLRRPKRAREFRRARNRAVMMVRRCCQAFAVAIVLFATPSVAERQEPNTIIFARMSGKCSTLKIAGRDFKCRAVAFYQTEEGRANFTIALDDPTDDRHIVTFSGDNGRRTQDMYELPIDRMLLNSKDRPKVDGLPVPFIEVSTGICNQLGNFVTGKVSSIYCAAVDQNGKRYELHYESDGSPISVRRISRRRAGHPAMSPFD